MSIENVRVSGPLGQNCLGMIKRLTGLTGLVLVATGALAAGVGSTAAQGGPTLSVIAGQGEGVVKAQDFVPSTIRIAVGTTVTWTVDSDDEHNVVFLAGTEGRSGAPFPSPRACLVDQLCSTRWSGMPCSLRVTTTAAT